MMTNCPSVSETSARRALAIQHHAHESIRHFASPPPQSLAADSAPRYRHVALTPPFRAAHDRPRIECMMGPSASQAICISFLAHRAGSRSTASLPVAGCCRVPAHCHPGDGTAGQRPQDVPCTPCRRRGRAGAAARGRAATAASCSRGQLVPAPAARSRAVVEISAAAVSWCSPRGVAAAASCRRGQVVPLLEVVQPPRSAGPAVVVVHAWWPDAPRCSVAAAWAESPFG